CLSAGYCAAVDQSGFVVEFNGLAWSSPVSIDPGHALDAISCPVASYCIAADTSGNVLAPSEPVNTGPPSINGAAQPGQTLSEAHGAYINSPSSYAYQWERCDGFGLACGNIPGAIGQTYLLGASDVGHMVRVEEQATNASGSSAWSLS